MMKYEILAKSGERIKGCGFIDVQIFVRANNAYYVFSTKDNKEIIVNKLPIQKVWIPLGNWFYVEEFKEEDRIVLNSKEFATFQRDCLFYGKYEGCKKLKEYIRTSLTYLRFSFPQWRLLYSVLWMTEEGYFFNQN